MGRDYSKDAIKRIFREPDDYLTSEFIKEWSNSCEYVTAHTSGSTGKPKEIKLSKRDMIESARATCEFFNLSSSSILVCPLSAGYIAGKMMIVRALVSGATLYMVSPHSNFEIPPTIEKVDLLPIVPSQLNGLIEIAKIVKIKNVIIGGAPLTTTQESLLKALPFQSYATYGMTETCSHVALKNITSRDEYFRALPGYTFSADTRDCLVIHNPLTSYKRLVTNDIIALHSDTSFTWLGRYDNVIITGGKKVHPEEVEKLIAGSLHGYNYYISSVPDEKWGEAVTLLIEGESWDTAKLETEMREVLLPHQRPKNIRFIPVFDRTATGKIKRTKV